MRSVRLLIMLLLVVICAHRGNCLGEEEKYIRRREAMVTEQIESRGISDKDVLRAMRKVERHLFVPLYLKEMAYKDTPLPIGYGQTISQPYIVAYMTEKARLRPGDKVLEIGAGSGYQAAVLAEMVKEVYTIEIVKGLADEAGERLQKLGYKNIHVIHGDGYLGWPDKAPFDAIIVTAAPEKVPATLVDQLKEGGRMVVPIGSFFQELYLIEKTKDGFKKKRLLPVRFVPMVSPAPASRGGVKERSNERGGRNLNTEDLSEDLKDHVIELSRNSGKRHILVRM